MWTLPKTKQAQDIFPYAADMMVSDLDLKEQGSILASQYMWRSKPSPATTWSRRLKREPWVREFTTQILKPSHTESFEDALTSYLADFHVSPFLKPVKETEIQTQDTCSPTSKEELPSVGQLSLFSKTSMESSVPSSKEQIGKIQQERPFCSMSLENWKEWVTEQRQSRVQRQKSALLISETGGSLSGSWPTIAAADAKTGYQNRSNGKRGTQKNLETIVRDTSGPPAQEKSSLDGSRRELLEEWPTATAATGGGDTGATNNKRGKQAGNPLKTATGAIHGAKLNPRWVETLMGLPVGWVMPSCANPVTIVPMSSDCLETESCLSPAPQPLSEDLKSWPTARTSDAVETYEESK